MSTTKSRLHEIDILYAIGTILVIFGHSHSSDWNTFPKVFASLLDFVYIFHMPLFFAIAGFLLARSTSVSDFGYFTWLKDKALRLLMPYIVITLISFIPKYFFENKGLQGISVTPLIHAFLYPRDGVWGHFWFLSVLFLFYVIFGFLKYYDECGMVKTRALWDIFVFLLLLKFLPINKSFLSVGDICGNAFYFFAGYILFRFSVFDKIELNNLLRIVLCIGSIATSIAVFLLLPSKRIYVFIISVLMPTACLLAARILKYKRTVVFDFISKNLFTFYIYSWPAQTVVEVVCIHFSAQWYITTISMFIAGFIFPSVIIFVYNKLNFLHKRPVKLILGIR